MKIVGLMSGTSYDGVDVVAAEFTAVGETLRMRPLGHRELGYDEELRERIGAVLPPNPTTIEAVCRLDNALGAVFADAAALGVALAGGHADMVVSPGQTVFHWVDGGTAHGTLQLGAPARVAARVGVPVLSDLRSADVAAGGQGAPLVPVFDALLLASGDPDAGRQHRRRCGRATRRWWRAPGSATAGHGRRSTWAASPTSPWSRRTHPCSGTTWARPTPCSTRRPAGSSAGPATPTGPGRRPAGCTPDCWRCCSPSPTTRRHRPSPTGKELFHPGYLDERLAGLGEPVAPDDVFATLTELTARTVAAACARHRVPRWWRPVVVCAARHPVGRLAALTAGPCRAAHHRRTGGARPGRGGVRVRPARLAVLARAAGRAALGDRRATGRRAGSRTRPGRRTG